MPRYHMCTQLAKIEHCWELCSLYSIRIKGSSKQQKMDNDSHHCCEYISTQCECIRYWWRRRGLPSSPGLCTARQRWSAGCRYTSRQSTTRRRCSALSDMETNRLYLYGASSVCLCSKHRRKYRLQITTQWNFNTQDIIPSSSDNDMFGVVCSLNWITVSISSGLTKVVCGAFLWLWQHLRQRLVFDWATNMLYLMIAEDLVRRFLPYVSDAGLRLLEWRRRRGVQSSQLQSGIESVTLDWHHIDGKSRQLSLQYCNDG